MLKRPGLRVFLLLLMASPAQAQFTNVTSASGLAAIVDQRYQADPDWWLSGLHFVDLDGDGVLDLFLSAHGPGAVATLNDGHGAFSVAPGSYPDSEVHLHYDRDGDGLADLSMTYQDGGGRWWRNVSTPGSLDFVATPIVRGGNSARTQALVDLNRDGRVDWLRSAPPGLQIDFGQEDGGFAEGSRALTIPGTTSNNNASILPGDFDGDGDIDLLVLTGGNYDGTPGRTAFYRNQGDMTFVDASAAAGLPANGTLAKGIADLDQDGDLDFIAIANKTLPPVVYLNDGNGVFSLLPGAISGIPPATLTYSSWGTAVGTDFDNDGVLDVLMNGKYYLKLLRGTGGGHFTYMNTAWGVTDACACSIDDGLAFGDFDGDGDLDLVGYTQIAPQRRIAVYRNGLPARRFLNVRPLGVPGNRGAAGAKIRLFAPGTRQLLAYEQVAIYAFQAANSYYGYGTTERHFGLGSRTTVNVEVQFYPSGAVVHRSAVPADTTVVIPEIEAPPPPLTRYFTLTPCRVADTRNPPGPRGGPALRANSARVFPAAGSCGIPATAKAVAINATVTGATHRGNLRLDAADAPVPLASILNFVPGRTRANNAIVRVSPDGSVKVQCDMPSASTGQAHFLFDVYGYFQ